MLEGFNYTLVGSTWIVSIVVGVLATVYRNKKSQTAQIQQAQEEPVLWKAACAVKKLKSLENQPNKVIKQATFQQHRQHQERRESGIR